MLGLCRVFVAVLLLACIEQTACMKFIREIKKSCTAETDQGYVDLSSVAKTDGQSAAFIAVDALPGSQGTNTTWNPCEDTRVASLHCNIPGEVFLTSSASGGGCLTQASKSDANFTVRNGNLQLDYVSIYDVSTHITLKCVSTADSQPLTVDSVPCYDSSRLCYTLAHPVCCPTKTKPGGLSIGSIAVIIVLGLAVLYLVGGILFMKFVKKAEGVELCPNSEFWKSFPLLVKDGVLFVVRCGKVNN